MTVVYPTGDPALDVQNVQSAIDLGGTVLLKATDYYGNPQYFNFGDENGVGHVEVFESVTIKGEKGNIPLPNGQTADRTAIVGGGAFDSSAYGTFTMNALEDLTMDYLWFYGSSFTSLSVKICSGLQFSNNVVIDTIPFYVYEFDWTLAFGISVNELGYGRVEGNIVIENNFFDLYSHISAPVSFAIGIGVYSIKKEEDKVTDVYINDNEVINPGSCGILLSGAEGATAWIEKNRIVQQEYNRALFGNYNHGILVERWQGLGTSPVYIAHNRFFDIAVTGIQLVDVNDSVVKSNTVDMVGSPDTGYMRDGIYLWRSSDNTVQGNKVKGRARNGIIVLGLYNTGVPADNNVFVGNNLDNFEPTGPGPWGTPARHMWLLGENNLVVGLGLGTVFELFITN